MSVIYVDPTGFQLAAMIRMNPAQKECVLKLDRLEKATLLNLIGKSRDVSDLSRMGLMKRALPLTQEQPAGRKGTFYELTGLGKDVAEFLKRGCK